ncbi:MULTISPECIES: hypothetical protein [Streptomyces]|uniref:hypothetical protein n=1 Tax=Streptomyces TaxID=1883 RepID=UPI0023DD5606|nr:hypothetical protein [Streptomyces sp. FXJ1.172]WEP00846.1 hypothetical protein A6P39_042530 [Streptomyces sp. FXJ1.172]
MSHLTRDKVVDEWLAEAELAVQAAEQVVEAARGELEEAQGRLLRLQAAREVAAQADAVVRERAGEVVDTAVDQAECSLGPRRWRECSAEWPGRSLRPLLRPRSGAG